MKRLHKVSIDRSKMVGTEIISRFTYMDQEIMKNTEKEIEKAFNSLENMATQKAYSTKRR